MPYPRPGETESEFVKRFMGDEEAKRDYPDQQHRLGAAYGIYKHNAIHPKKQEEKKPDQKDSS